MYEYRAKLNRVVDADTIDLDVDLGFHISTLIRVRLLGVDAPEIFSVKRSSEEYQRGMAAKAFVVKWFEGAGAVSVVTQKTGKYGRWLGTILRTPPASMTVNPGQKLSLNAQLDEWLDDEMQDRPKE